MSRKVYVFAGWNGNKRIGTLYCDVIRGEEVFSFSYDPEWERKRYIICLDPTLPYNVGRIYSPDKKMFGAFTDACPDRWGKALLQRRENLAAKKEKRRPRTITETSCLLDVSDVGRHGGFRVSEDPMFHEPALGIDRFKIPPVTDLRSLERAAALYEDSFEFDEETLRILFEPGSSLGGARPKANVTDAAGNLWIAKFPSKRDSYDLCAWEKTMMDLALSASINTPETNLIRISDDRSIFLSKRFDREVCGGEMKRIHFASAMTMLGERDGSGSNSGYLDIADSIVKISGCPNADLEELFIRAAFDIAVSNHDNHLRNHGFLLKNSVWELSPVYDINPVPYSETLSLYIDLDTNVRSFDILISTAQFYQLSPRRAKEIVAEVAKTVSSGWEYAAKRNGIRRGEREMMSQAFSLAGEYAGDHKLYESVEISSDEKNER